MPRFPDALTAFLSQLTYYATSFSRLGFDFRTPHLPLFEDAVRTRVSAEFSRAVKEFARTPETGWAAVGAPRGGAGTTARAPYTATGTGRLSPHRGTCQCAGRSIR